MTLRIFGVEVGWDEAVWFCGSWEFGVFDQGWLVAKGRVIRWEGRWPTYWTFHPLRWLRRGR